MEKSTFTCIEFHVLVGACSWDAPEKLRSATLTSIYWFNKQTSPVFSLILAVLLGSYLPLFPLSIHCCVSPENGTRLPLHSLQGFAFLISVSPDQPCGFNKSPLDFFLVFQASCHCNFIGTGCYWCQNMWSTGKYSLLNLPPHFSCWDCQCVDIFLPFTWGSRDLLFDNKLKSK